MSPDARMGVGVLAAWLTPLLLAAGAHWYLRRGAPGGVPPLWTVILGMLTLGGAAMLLSQGLARITMLPWQTPLAEPIRLAVEASFGAGIPEEAAKWPLILALVLFTGPRSRGAALLRGLTVGLGFAGFENSFSALHAEPLAVFTGHVTSTMSHAFWGILAGWCIGRAYESPFPKAALLLAGFLVPTLLHSVEDFLIGISIPGSLMETTVTVPKDAAPSTSEVVGILGALGLWIGQLVWCGRLVRSCRSGLLLDGAAV